MSNSSAGRKISESGAQEGLLESVSHADLVKRFSDLIPKISDEAAAQFATYYLELVRFNKTLNLISSTAAKNADVVYFADSALATELVHKALVPGAPVYDIGSGNGFPGLVIAILHPELNIVLADRDRRKGEFLKHMIATLDLKNVVHEMIELESLPVKSIKNMVSRGFAPLHRSLLLARKSVAMGGRYFHLKGDGWANELAGVPSQLFSFWSPSLLGQYRLPETSTNMAVLLTEKIAD